MAQIKTIKINDELYGSIKDIVRVIKETKDINKALEIIAPKTVHKVELKVNEPLEDDEELSDFNKKLKKGLDWNPRKES